MLGVAIFATTTFAQPKKAEKAKPAAPAKKEMAALKPASTPAPVSKMKADGTPDKRFKAATPAVPAKPAVPATPASTKMKADGTPDKRFKENKTPAGPLKKDGTPDMRYKVNKDAKKKA